MNILIFFLLLRKARAINLLHLNSFVSKTSTLTPKTSLYVKYWRRYATFKNWIMYHGGHNGFSIFMKNAPEWQCATHLDFIMGVLT